MFLIIINHWEQNSCRVVNTFFPLCRASVVHYINWCRDQDYTKQALQSQNRCAVLLWCPVCTVLCMLVQIALEKGNKSEVNFSVLLYRNWLKDSLLFRIYFQQLSTHCKLHCVELFCCRLIFINIVLFLWYKQDVLLWCVADSWFYVCCWDALLLGTCPARRTVYEDVSHAGLVTAWPPYIRATPAGTWQVTEEGRTNSTRGRGVCCIALVSCMLSPSGHTRALPLNSSLFFCANVRVWLTRLWSRWWPHSKPFSQSLLDPATST